MNKIIFLFLFTLSLYADTTSKSGDPACPSEADSKDMGNFVQITFYGDSLGDFVDSPGWGNFGWDTYLKIHKPEMDWRVQNLAVAGWRTRDVINMLKTCADVKNRNRFVTSNHAAFEIGGNDMVDWMTLI